MMLSPIAKKKAKSVAYDLGDKLLVPIAAATAGGVAANQFPQNKKSSKKALKDISKNLSPIIKSDDPLFDHEYAQKMADAVMKMDDDEAEMFTYLTMASVLEEDIEKNQRTLQRHVDEVALKTIADVKKAAQSAISKADSPEARAYLEKLERIEKAVKNPYEFGFYEFEESDFRRDPRSGRFMTKITQAPKGARRLSNKQEKNLGIKVDPEVAAKLSNKQRVEMQHEYMQIANFLNAAQQSGGSGAKIRLQVTDKEQDGRGGRYWVEVNGRPKPGRDWDPKTERVLAVEAEPEGGLTLGGAAFGLQPALSRNTVAGINAADKEFGGFAQNWTRDDYNQRNSNERLYNRVKTGSEFVGAIAPPGSKAALAAKFGTAVGQHGPQAEKVIGPHARKTAYRYRGTEKRPDGELLRQYNLVTQEANKPGVDLKNRARERAALTRARNNWKREQATAWNANPANKGKPLDMNAIKIPRDVDAQLMVAAQKQAKDKASEPQPLSDDAKRAGIEVLMRHLEDPDRPGRPKKSLYRLQLESGTTPPSEGFILDKNGKITAQAVGYGDDHYLPFNLKNLKSLRGGEYIRTRSVGGPTSEDIYTGLMTGAQRVTVVSRSGIFTIDFADDFKGKRRYNDKALRMTRRYEKLLDTVQSGKVERDVQVAPEIRQFITAGVIADGYDREERRGEVKRRIQTYKNELNATSDEAEFRELVEEFITARAESEAGDLPEGQRNALISQMHNDWRRNNEYMFRLNGEGYKDALFALEEQFPYYFKTDYKPRRDDQRIETEIDQGYVEPGRNRPTAARGGLYGTAANQTGEVGSQKFSASQADYQRGRGLKGSNTQKGEVTTSNGELKEKPEASQDKDAFKAKKDKIVYAAAAAKLMAEASNAFKAEDRGNWVAKDGSKPLLKDDAEMREWLKDPHNAREFDAKWAEWKNIQELRDRISAEAIKGYGTAVGRVGKVKYEDNLALNPKAKFEFKDPAFKDDAKPAVREAMMRKLSSRTKPISTDKTLAALDEAELVTEIEMLAQAYEMIRDEETEEGKVNALMADGLRRPNAERLAREGALFRHLKDVHQAKELVALGVGREATLRPKAKEEKEEGVVTHHVQDEKKTDDPVKGRREELERRLAKLYQSEQVYADNNDDEKADLLAAAAASLENVLNENEVISENLFTATLGAHDTSGVTYAMVNAKPKQTPHHRTKNITTKRDN